MEWTMDRAPPLLSLEHDTIMGFTRIWDNPPPDAYTTTETSRPTYGSGMMSARNAMQTSPAAITAWDSTMVVLYPSLLTIGSHTRSNRSCTEKFTVVRRVILSRESENSSENVMNRSGANVTMIAWIT